MGEGGFEPPPPEWAVPTGDQPMTSCKVCRKHEEPVPVTSRAKEVGARRRGDTSL